MRHLLSGIAVTTTLLVACGGPTAEPDTGIATLDAFMPPGTDTGVRPDAFVRADTGMRTDAPVMPGDDAAVAPGDDAAIAPGDDAAIAPGDDAAVMMTDDAAMVAADDAFGVVMPDAAVMAERGGKLFRCLSDQVDRPHGVRDLLRELLE